MTRLRTLARHAAAVLTFPALVLVDGIEAWILAAEQRREDDGTREAHHRLQRERTR